MRRLLFALLIALLPAAARAEARDPQQHFFQTFLGDLRSEAADLASQGRKGIVLIFEMDECPFCERMHGAILSRKEVQQRYRREFGLFRIDIKASGPIVDLSGRSTTESALARELKIRGTPTTVFFDLDGKELYRYVGPPRDPEEFLMLATYVSSGEYRHRPFRQFRQEAK